MRRRIALAVSAIMILFFAAGCNKTNHEYISSFTTSNSEETISFEISDSDLHISGTLDENSNHNYILVTFDKANEEGSTIQVINNSFDGSIAIPDKNGEVTVEVFGGTEQYGNFESIIIDFIKIKKDNKTWKFVSSPVIEANREIFNADKDENDYIEADERIQSDDPDIIRLSNDITREANSDYEKVKAIHDWVAVNIYYDYDGLFSGNYGEIDSVNVLKNRKGVCEGYANLFAALVRSQNIPCRVQSGYALGIGTDKEWNSTAMTAAEGNHAWNEAFVDGRWIIVDATWDSQNKYQNGQYIKGDFITHLYFDASLEFFSLSHRLINSQPEQ